MGDPFTTSLSDVKKFVERFHDSDIRAFAALAQVWDDMAHSLANGEDLTEDDFVTEGIWTIAQAGVSLREVLVIAGRISDE